MRQMPQWSRFIAGLGVACGVAAVATPAHATYQLITQLAVPSTAANPFPNTAGPNTAPFTSYDISFFDANTQNYFVTDRTNASVDEYSAKTNSFVTQIGGFVGLLAGSPSAPVPVLPPAPGTPAPVTSISGPDGVLTVNLPGQRQLWAGDGNSTLRGFDLSKAGNPPIPGTPIATGTPADRRVDEMAFDPKSNLLLVANNAAATPFATLIRADTNAIVAKIVFDGTNGTPNLTGAGIEQPVWDPNTQKFYLNIDPTTGPGGAVQIDETGKVTHIYDLASFGIGSCGPAGLAVGKNSLLGIDCGAVGSSTVTSPAIFLDPTKNGGNGAIVATFNQLGGGDEVWYDPTTGYFFFTGYRNTAQAPGLLVIDGNAATPSLVQFISTSVGSHSVAVDPVSGEIFVPAGGAVAGAVCPNGCILVFGQVAAVPEPGSLALIASAFAGLAGFAGWRRRRS